MKIELKLAAIDDIPAILALHVEATHDLCQICDESFGEGLGAKKDLSEEEADYLKAALKDSDAVMIVARKNTDVIGFGHAVVERHGDDFLTAPFMTVNILAVKSEFRREGIGKIIVAELEEWARRKGLTAVDLAVFEGNERAQRLFKKSGYHYVEHRMAKKL